MFPHVCLLSDCSGGEGPDELKTVLLTSTLTISDLSYYHQVQVSNMYRQVSSIKCIVNCNINLMKYLSYLYLQSSTKYYIYEVSTFNKINVKPLELPEDIIIFLK